MVRNYSVIFVRSAIIMILNKVSISPLINPNFDEYQKNSLFLPWTVQCPSKCSQHSGAFDSSNTPYVPIRNALKYAGLFIHLKLNFCI